MSYQTARNTSYNQPVPRKRHGATEPIDEFSQRVGNFIDAKLKGLNWDQKQLADKMGLSQSMLSRLLAGTSKFNLSYLIAASKALGVPVSELVYASLDPNDPASQVHEFTGTSYRSRKVAPGLNEWLGAHSDDITPRERRWLESIDFLPEDRTGSTEFWDGIIRVFRSRHQAGD